MNSAIEVEQPGQPNRKRFAQLIREIYPGQQVMLLNTDVLAKESELLRADLSGSYFVCVCGDCV
jgi:hypothetical protein